MPWRADADGDFVSLGYSPVNAACGRAALQKSKAAIGAQTSATVASDQRSPSVPRPDTTPEGLAGLRTVFSDGLAIEEGRNITAAMRASSPTARRHRY